MTAPTNGSVISKQPREISSDALEIYVSYWETIGNCTEITTNITEVSSDSTEIFTNYNEISADSTEIFANYAEKHLYYTEIKALVEEHPSTALGQILTIT